MQNGISDFSAEMRVLKRAKDYLVGEIVEDHGVSTARCAIISNIEAEWLRRFDRQTPILKQSRSGFRKPDPDLNEAFQP